MATPSFKPEARDANAKGGEPWAWRSASWREGGAAGRRIPRPGRPSPGAQARQPGAGCGCDRQYASTPPGTPSPASPPIAVGRDMQIGRRLVRFPAPGAGGDSTLPPPQPVVACSRLLARAAVTGPDVVGRGRAGVVTRGSLSGRAGYSDARSPQAGGGAEKGRG